MKKLVLGFMLAMSLTGIASAQDFQQQQVQQDGVQYLKGSVESVRRYQITESQPSVGGGLVGGVAGGLIGNQMGQGNGKTAMSIIGGILGGAVGSVVASNDKKVDMAEVEIFFPVGTGFTYKFNYLDKGWYAGQTVEVAFKNGGEQFMIIPVSQQ